MAITAKEKKGKSLWRIFVGLLVEILEECPVRKNLKIRGHLSEGDMHGAVWGKSEE
jgi:hypothetical protein